MANRTRFPPPSEVRIALEQTKTLYRLMDVFVKAVDPLLEKTNILSPVITLHRDKFPECRRLCLRNHDPFNQFQGVMLWASDIHDYCASVPNVRIARQYTRNARGLRPLTRACAALTQQLRTGMLKAEEKGLEAILIRRAFDTEKKLYFSQNHVDDNVVTYLLREAMPIISVTQHCYGDGQAKHVARDIGSQAAIAVYYDLRNYAAAVIRMQRSHGPYNLPRTAPGFWLPDALRAMLRD